MIFSGYTSNAYLSAFCFVGSIPSDSGHHEDEQRRIESGEVEGEDGCALDEPGSVGGAKDMSCLVVHQRNSSSSSPSSV